MLNHESFSEVKGQNSFDHNAFKTCLSWIGSHHGINISSTDLNVLVNQEREANGPSIVRAARKIGLTAKEILINFESISKAPHPSIAKVFYQEDLLYGYIIIFKASKKGVTIINPDNGKKKVYGYKEFNDIWLGVLVIFAKDQDLGVKGDSAEHFIRLWKIIQPHKTILLQALFGAMVFTGLGLSISIYVQKITDYVLVGGNRNLLNLMSFMMIGIILFQVYIGTRKNIIVLKVGQLIDAQLILSYYKHLLNLPQSFFDTKQVGEIISRVHDAVNIRTFINGVSIEMFVNIFIVFFSFVLMFTYYWKLALIMLLVIPIYLLVYWLINNFNKKVERRVMERYADFNSHLVESIGNIKSIKQFGVEDYFYSKIENRFVKLLFTFYKSGLNGIFSGTSTLLVGLIFTVLLLWIGSGYVLDGYITTGELFSFYALIAYFTGPIQSLIGMNKAIQNALIATDRLFEIMDLEREKNENKIQFGKEDLGDILFDNVSFRYKSRTEVFKNFTVKIQKNKITAIVGESGSGKTTLISLLQNLYSVDSGNIKIGNYDLKHVDSKSLRNLISVIPQELHLFSGNIIENIALGENSPDMNRVFLLSEKLGITPFVEKLPDNFETQIGENGAMLSGGQRQRISLARALYKNPEILLLDEPTSALDTHSENLIKKVLHEYNEQGKTIIIIAHRLSTISNADVILVLKNGSIIESGSHDELLKKEKEYFRLWQGQS